MTSKNAPVVAEKAGAVADPMAGMSESGNLDSSDIQIPRLHLLQGLSEGVDTGEFKMGDVLHTGDQVVLGGKEAPLLFLPFHIMKVNQKFRSDVSPKEYICTEDFDSGREWEQKDYTWEQRDGTEVSCAVNNYKTFIVHGILPGDDDDIALPVSITFRSSAGRGVKPLVSHFATVAQFNELKGTNNKAHTVVWDLGSVLIKENGNSFAKWTLKKARKATAEEIEECDQWVVALAQNAKAYAEHSALQENKDGDATEQAPMAAKSKPVATPDDIPF